MATQYDYIFSDRGHTLREIKTGKLFPFRSCLLTAGTPLPARTNTHFFVKTIDLSFASLGTDSGTELKVTGKIFNEDNYLARLVKTGSLVGWGSQEFSVMKLLDKEAPLNFSAANITTTSCLVTFAEVDDIER